MAHPICAFAGRAGAGGLALLALALLAGAPLLAQEADGPLYAFRPPASWVDIATPDYAAEIGDEGVADGAAVLLLDRQLDVADDGDAHYQHFAVRVLNSVGIDTWSQADISVDPGFQTLDIHWLQIVRDGAVIDQRARARITAEPEESDLRSRIYNGRYRVDVLFADLRAGDVIDYAYTVSSRERLFPGHFATQLYTGWSLPVHRHRIRIRSPLERPLRYRLSDSEVVPAAEARDGAHELVMEWRDVAPVAGDPDRPGWYDPWPYLEASDLQSWAEVSDLVSPLFSARERGGPRVAAVVSELGAGGGTPQEQALRALQFVQDEIAYASIAIGRGTHEPADPDTVLERRYGDCKDKSLLLSTLLEGLGIPAEPALVHSTEGRALDRRLPTPYAFDHAIVQARIGEEVYWLDATESTRYEPLSGDSPADYERALLVHAPSPELRAIPKPATNARRRELLMEFDLRDGLEAPAALTMTTWYRGRLADTMRAALQRGSPEQRKVDYANYIASWYPGATPAAPIAISDDKAQNVVEVREYYTLPRTFTRNDEDSLVFFLHADELYRYSEPLDASVRASPLALEYPIHVRQKLVVHLPDEWTIEPETVTVDNPAFRYRSDVSYADRTLRIAYEYEALADHVSVAELAQYQEDRQRFYDDTGFRLSSHPEAADSSAEGLSGLAPAPVAATLLALVLSAWGAIRWGRWSWRSSSWRLRSRS